MSISIDVDSLEELDEIRDKTVLADFILGSVKLLHEVDKGWQLKAIGI